MTIAFIQPNTVMREDQPSPSVSPQVTAAHHYCRNCGEASFVMGYDIQAGRGFFIVDPLAGPKLTELRYRGYSLGWDEV